MDALAQPRHPRRDPGAGAPFPVYLQNDATAACGAELVFGRPARLRDFIYFYIGAFVGGGIVLNGGLYGGPTGNAGALGSMPVPGAGGAPRQLIDVASIAMLEKALNAQAAAMPRSLWTSPRGLGRPRRGARRTGSPRPAQALAYAIVAASSVIDFEAAVIDGWMPARCAPRLVAAIGEALQKIDVEGLTVPPVREGTVGIHARALGGASLPLSTASWSAPPPSRLDRAEPHADRHTRQCSARNCWRPCARWAMATRSPSSTATTRRCEHARRLVRADGHGVIADHRRDPASAAGRRFRAAGAVPRDRQGRPRMRSIPIHHEMIAVCERRAPGHRLVPLPGDAFYDRIKAAHTVVATSEPSLYGNMIIRKGVIYPERRRGKMIMCCGEALIDMLPRESTDGEPAFAPYAGGAVFNTAIALGRLGVPVGFFSGLSSDLFGQQLRDALADEQGRPRYATDLGRGRPRSPSCVSSTATPPTCSMTRTPPAACSTRPTCRRSAPEVEAHACSAASA